MTDTVMTIDIELPVEADMDVPSAADWAACDADMDHQGD